MDLCIWQYTVAVIIVTTLCFSEFFSQKPPLINRTDKQNRNIIHIRMLELYVLIWSVVQFHILINNLSTHQIVFSCILAICPEYCVRDCICILIFISMLASIKTKLYFDLFAKYKKQFHVSAQCSDLVTGRVEKPGSSGSLVKLLMVMNTVQEVQKQNIFWNNTFLSQQYWTIYLIYSLLASNK